MGGAGAAPLSPAAVRQDLQLLSGAQPGRARGAPISPCRPLWSRGLAHQLWCLGRADVFPEGQWKAECAGLSVGIWVLLQTELGRPRTPGARRLVARPGSICWCDGCPWHPRGRWGPVPGETPGPRAQLCFLSREQGRHPGHRSLRPLPVLWPPLPRLCGKTVVEGPLGKGGAWAVVGGAGGMGTPDTGKELCPWALEGPWAAGPRYTAHPSEGGLCSGAPPAPPRSGHSGPPCPQQQWLTSPCPSSCVGLCGGLEGASAPPQDRSCGLGRAGPSPGPWAAAPAADGPWRAQGAGGRLSVPAWALSTDGLISPLSRGTLS